MLRALALDLDSLRLVKPDIILTTVTGFGAGGPLSHKHGFDGIGQAMSGAAYLSGTPDQPIAIKLPWVDFGTACLSAFGTLAALIERGKTGRGQKVEGALLRTAIAFANATLIEQALTRVDRTATLNRGFNSAPADIFRCTDGWIVATVIGPAMFRRWSRMIGEDQWLADPRFGDDQSRADNGEIISARMSQWCAERSCAEALEALEEANIVAGQVYSPQQALDDPHIRAAGLLAEVTFPGAWGDIAAGPDPDRALRNPGHLSPAGAAARRAHRRDPPEPRLWRHRDRRAAPGTRRLSPRHRQRKSAFQHPERGRMVDGYRGRSSRRNASAPGAITFIPPEASSIFPTSRAACVTAYRMDRATGTLSAVQNGRDAARRVHGTEHLLPNSPDAFGAIPLCRQPRPQQHRGVRRRTRRGNLTAIGHASDRSSTQCL